MKIVNEKFQFSNEPQGKHYTLGMGGEAGGYCITMADEEWLTLSQFIQTNLKSFHYLAPIPEFKVGDLVVLKSGGPVMTIHALNVDLVCTTWVGAGRIDSASFPPACLEKPPIGGIANPILLKHFLQWFLDHTPVEDCTSSYITRMTCQGGVE